MSDLTTRFNGRHPVLIISALAFLVVLALGISLFATAHASTALDVAGYLNFSYGEVVKDEPTAEKAESKVWWNDGFWWGSLYNPDAGEYQIYQLDLNTHDWISTGVAIDDREESRADALWDAGSNQLYVVSHIKVDNPAYNNNPDNWARLYRYTYNSVTDTYSLDTGFPVTVNKDKTETLVLDKDSSGRLWVSYVSRKGTSGYHVYVNHSTNSDLNWSTPFTLTATITQAQVTLQDISSVIAFEDTGGAKVGVMWSNGNDDNFYFASHPVASNPTDDWTLETGLDIPYPANDHINLKVTSGGHVLAAVKTSATTATDPLIGVISRDLDGTFRFHEVSPVDSADTNPIIVLHSTSNQAYVFSSSNPVGGQICYQNATLLPLASLSFPVASCTSPAMEMPSMFPDMPVFIGSSTYRNINHPSSTKQETNETTGILVIAADDSNGSVYVHNNFGGVTPPGPTATHTATPGATATSTSTPIATSTSTSTPTTTPVATTTGTPSPTATGEPGPTATPTATIPPEEMTEELYLPIIRR